MDQISGIKNNLMNDEFDSLANSEERVEYAFERLGSTDNIRLNVHKYLSEHKTQNMKSMKRSQEYREKGNLYFSTKNYEYALYYFNYSVLWAPYPSHSGLDSDNELSYAFTARSLTFFEMKAYENALYDINCALKLSELSMKFKERLQLMTHKVYCLCRLRRYYTAMAVITAMVQLVPCLPINNQIISSLISIKEEITDKLQEESGESADLRQSEDHLDTIEKHLKNIEFFRSPELHLTQTEEKGRHYRTAEPIPKGKLIAVEKAISAVIFKPFNTTHCNNCLKNIGYKGWPCRQCSQVVFCDEECVANAEQHSYECGLIDILHDFGCNHHLLYRIILLVGPQMAIQLAKETVNPEDISDGTDNNKVNYIKFLQLVDHKDKYGLKNKVPTMCRSIQIAFVLDFFEDLRPTDQTNENFLKEMSALLDAFNYKAFVNVFGIYEYKSSKRPFRGGHIGNALMFESSFFNHSCSPNAYWLFNGRHISIVTTKDIDKDEEVCISYGPYSKCMPYDERQTFLKNRYFFRCNCKDCLSDGRNLPSLKCNFCSDGFFLYKKDAEESSCMNCGKTLDISSVIKRVEETENEFNQWMDRFDKDNNRLTLIRAEICVTNFQTYLNPKCEQMIEINTRLSRSFETIGHYSKAMFYSKKILESLDQSIESLRFCTEMVFYSRVYYYYLYKERNILAIDDEWRDCFKTISETLVILKNCKDSLERLLADNLPEKQTIKDAIEVIDENLKTKEKQILIISKMTDNSVPDSGLQPMDE